MFEQPDGIDDMLADAEFLPPAKHPFHDLLVPGVGMVHARRPMANAAANLAMSENSKLDAPTRQEHRIRFLRDHLEPGEHERMTEAMIRGDMPFDATEKVVRAVATWGTGRPT